MLMFIQMIIVQWYFPTSCTLIYMLPRTPLDHKIIEELIRQNEQCFVRITQPICSVMHSGIRVHMKSAESGFFEIGSTQSVDCKTTLKEYERRASTNNLRTPRLDENIVDTANNIEETIYKLNENKVKSQLQIP